MLTCEEVLGCRGSAGVVLHHLQLDFVLLARSQAGLLKGGLGRAQRIQDLSILLFLSSRAQYRNPLSTMIEAIVGIVYFHQKSRGGQTLKRWPHVSVVCCAQVWRAEIFEEVPVKKRYKVARRKTQLLPKELILVDHWVKETSVFIATVEIK